MPSAAEIRELDETELENKLVEARKELFNLRFQSATGRLDNNARVEQVRRDIARLLTVQRAREIELAESRRPSRLRSRRGRRSSDGRERGPSGHYQQCAANRGRKSASTAAGSAREPSSRTTWTRPRSSRS